MPGLGEGDEGTLLFPHLPCLHQPRSSHLLRLRAVQRVVCVCVCAFALAHTHLCAYTRARVSNHAARVHSTLGFIRRV